MDQGRSQPSQATPARTRGRVPVGHIVASDRWRGSELGQVLQGQVNTLFEDQMGLIDFHPSSDVGVIYLPEGELVAGTSYKRKLAKLRKADQIRGVVLAEKTRISSQYFPGLQKFAVLELGLVLLPVTSQTEAANLLAQLVHLENRPTLNQFRLKRKQAQPDAALLTAVQTIPKLGEVKARLLLERFRSIAAMCNASVEELALVVGRSSAIQVQNFLRGDRA